MSQSVANSETQNATYDVFISYAHEDSEAVREIVDALREAKIKVFDAAEQQGIMWGQDLKVWIEDRLHKIAPAVIVVLSEKYMQSKWCSKEVEYLARYTRKNPSECCLLPIRLDEVAPPEILQDVVWLERAEISPKEIAVTVQARIKSLQDSSQVPLAELSDEELWQRVANARDTEAFGILYTRLYPMVLRYILRLTSSHSDAEDVLSEVMIRLWENASRIREGISLRPYVFALARNVALDYLRKRRSLASTDFTTEDPALVSPSPEDTIVRQELRESLARAIHELPEKERDVVILRMTSELSLTEISQALGVPTYTVTNLYSRAVKKLRKVVAIP